MRRTKTSQPLKSKIEVPWDTTGALNSDSQVSISLDRISLPPTQPRRYFDSEALRQLTESIKQHGILQPLLVRIVDAGKLELVAGERRYRAALEIGLKEVPVVIRELDENAAYQLALIENLLREDLNPVEETEGILQLLALKLGRNLEEIPPLLRRLQHERKASAKSSNNVIGKKKFDSLLSEEDTESAPDNLDDNDVESNVLDSEEVSNNVIGKGDDKPEADNQVNPDLIIVEEVFDGLGLMTWESFANNRLPLLNLPEDILEALRKGNLEYTKAKAIAQIQDKDERTAFLEQAIAQNWSLSEIKQYISENKAPNTQKTEPNNYKERFTAATAKLRKSRIWSDPSKRKQVEKLLDQLEMLGNVG
ncbi:chromosome partitioning protein ParB [Dulcicalothrix desertica PCC 7102]|uniref:Chromosome partitioning protein ParB n=1 Tax=Dulcicalothrix desertica PCC 7102 TaxID=232991 RepID=A0A3S1BWI3_9CYAN|nr:ParB/RepB/Spo0J family partition protein [Dulcicalothrix desertica]RUS92673.1 chromosome partitioning protein ParB [Dulcicalothrix desertica PCC 7102]TWH61382.1 ParB family chromosome partitioning protein [Dulcicalothrix desertica PCC 7102]